MISTYELVVQTTDFLGKTRNWEFIVIAKDEAELSQEIGAVMQHHDEVENWSVMEIRSQEALDADNPHLVDYLSKGVHSYYS